MIIIRFLSIRVWRIINEAKNQDVTDIYKGETMLVRFSSQATANLLMFDDVARVLLSVIGKSPTQRGVITVDEMPSALVHLHALLEHESRVKEGREPREELPIPEVGIEPHELVGLSVRAQPFIKTLQQALREKKEITWEAPKDFAN
ncbi:MAG: DUF1840 domain-containing protein [Rhodocyclaceae bacterium]|nr:DUF1840 domain-containing protein [Rhodocyclaceae bacterium]